MIFQDKVELPLWDELPPEGAENADREKFPPLKQCLSFMAFHVLRIQSQTEYNLHKK